MYNTPWRSWLCAALLGLAGAAPGTRAEPQDALTGRQVRQAVRDGVRAILQRQNADGTWTEYSYAGGQTCLSTLALLQAGQPAPSPPIAAALRRIAELPNRHTYVVSLKVMVLARADPDLYRPQLESAARWLVKAQNVSGLWNYTETGPRFDHSNTQFALLGLDAAAQAGVEIPPAAWKRAQDRLIANQNDDGGWAYQADGDSYGSMTAAGVADLLILGNRPHERIARRYDYGDPTCVEYRTNRPLTRGLSWLARNFRPDQNPPNLRAYRYYWLYAVERCGILSGQRFFGAHDWYRAGARFLVHAQGHDGLWNRDLADTCFAVLFLAKGHTALVIQKLRWSNDLDWSPVRYDLEHLVAFIDHQLGEPVGWQAVPLDAPLEDWLAAPLLYIHGHRFPQLDDPHREKLRQYVQHGGTLLFEACCGRADFAAGFREFAASTFAGHPLRTLGPEHAVYRVLHELSPPAPDDATRPGWLQGIDIGCRTAVIFSPRDLSCLWELATVPDLSQQAFQLGANIAAYAIGRRPLQDRIDAIVLPERTPAADTPDPLAGLRLAQVVYEGDWRPFPFAALRLAEFVRDELRIDVVTQYRQVRLTDDSLYASPILFLAGHHDFTLPDAERAALRDHLRRGGFLLADACCGSRDFEVALRRLVAQMFPEQSLERLPPDHPIFAGTPGFRIGEVQYSPDVQREQPQLRAPVLWGLELDGRLAIVYSPYSLSCGLSGAAYEGCWGLSETDARQLGANIVLHALTH